MQMQRAVLGTFMSRYLFILVACGVLSACSATPKKPTSASIEGRADKVATNPVTSGAEGSTGNKDAQVSEGGIESIHAKSPVLASAAPHDIPISTEQGSTLRTNEESLANENEKQQQSSIATSLASRSIFFDYDGYSIKPEYQAIVIKSARLLISTPKLQVRLEGNADERGSREYNLALGQKRAEAVRKALLLNGVPDSSIEAISYGREKPRAECLEERCWTINRRVDFSENNTSANQ